MNDRQRRNFISSIKTNQGLVEKVDHVKSEIMRHFTNHLQESRTTRHNPSISFFHKLSWEDSRKMEEPFTNEEIKVIV